MQPLRVELDFEFRDLREFMSNNEILAQLTDILEQRKAAEPDSSYVANLYAKGLDAILKKIGEEATETVMAAKDITQGSDVDKLKGKLVVGGLGN